MTPSPGTRAWARRAFAIGCLVVATLACTAAPASAHATLLRTDPPEGAVLDAVPDVVTFTFDEHITTTSGSIQVFDAEGQPVEASGNSRDDVLVADLPDHLDDGTYVVVWRVISADSHPVAGSLTFSIGAPSLAVAAPDLKPPHDERDRVWLSAVQAASYVGLLMCGGLVLFTGWTVRGLRLDDAVASRLRRSRGVARLLAIGAGFLAVPLAGAYRQGIGLGDLKSLDLSLVHDDLTVLALQVAGLSIALLLVDRHPRWAVVAAGLAVVSPSAVGHSRAFDPVSLLIITDAVHLMAGAIWLGGLIGLAVTLPSLRARPQVAAVVLSRFSTLAAAVLGMLVVTGTVMSWRIVDSWSGFVDTGFGCVLLVKIGVVCLIAAVAGWNRFRLLPALVRAAGATPGPAPTRRLGATVRVEAVLVVAVLGLTGFLVNLSPHPVPETRQPVASRVQAALAGDDKVLATLVPAHRGRNVIQVQVQDATGEPVTSYRAPEVSVRSDTLDLGVVPCRAVASGTYEADVLIPTAGRWEIEVSLRASRFDNPVATLAFTVE